MASSKVPSPPVSFADVGDMRELVRRLERMKDDVYQSLAGDTHTSNGMHAYRDAVDRQTGNRVTYYLRRGVWVPTSLSVARPVD